MKKTTLFVLLPALIVGVIFSTTVASAYRGQYEVKGPNYNEERHELMEKAFDSLDYDSWYELMTENGRHPRVLEVVTKENFEVFVKAREAAINGDLETASDLRSQLGLNQGFMQRNNAGRGMGGHRGKNIRQNNFVDADEDGVCDNFGSRRANNAW